MSRFVDVLVTLPFSPETLNRLSSVSPRLRIVSYKGRAGEDIPADIWARTEVLYTGRALPQPDQAPSLRWVQFHTAGIDQVLDAPILKRPGLQITNLSGVSATQMAEFAVMMLLALGHHLPDLHGCQRRSEWPADRQTRFEPVELRGSTVGIVGYGSVGRQTARLLHAFGARILAAKRDVMHPDDTGYMPEGLGDPQADFVRRLYPIQALRSMLRECDFVLVTTPLTAETRGLIGAAELAACKPSAGLVDLSRGGVIEPAALLHALRERKIAGAALDVFPDEPLPADSPLWKLPNVLITPHISGLSAGYESRAAAFFGENLHRYLADLPLYNYVDIERGY